MVREAMQVAFSSNPKNAGKQIDFNEKTTADAYKSLLEDAKNSRDNAETKLFGSLIRTKELDSTTSLNVVAALRGQTYAEMYDEELAKFAKENNEDPATYPTRNLFDEKFTSNENVKKMLTEQLKASKNGTNDADIEMIGQKALNGITKEQNNILYNAYSTIEKSLADTGKKISKNVAIKNNRWAVLKNIENGEMLDQVQGLTEDSKLRIKGALADNDFSKLSANESQVADSMLLSNAMKDRQLKLEANESVTKRFSSFKDNLEEARGYGKDIARRKAIEDYAAARQMNVSDLSKGQVAALTDSVNFGFDLEELKKRLSMSFSPEQLEQNELARKGGFTSYVRTKEDDKWKENLIEIKALQDKMNQNLANIAQHTKALEGN